MARDLYFVSGSARHLYRLATSGAAALLTGLLAPSGTITALTEHNGELLGINRSTREMFHYTITGDVVARESRGTFPTGVNVEALTSHAGDLLAGEQNGNLRRVNPADASDESGTYGLIADITGIGEVRNLASSGGVLYATDFLDNPDTLQSIVYTATTATATEIGAGPTGFDAIFGMTAHLDVLYGLESNRDLWTIDTAAPINSTSVAITGGPSGSGQAIASHDPDPPPDVDLAATGATGAVTGTATLTVTPGLTLADFDTTGLDVEFAALIEAAAPANIFQQAPRPARGSLVDGELDLDSDGTAITRVSWNTSTSQLRLNDNDTAFDMNAFFGTGGAGHDLTLRFQTTPDNAVEVNVEDVYTAGGNNAHVRFNVGSAMAALLNAVGDGDRFIIAAYRAEAGPDVDLAATGATGAVTGTATLTVTPPPNRPCGHWSDRGRHGNRHAHRYRGFDPRSGAT